MMNRTSIPAVVKKNRFSMITFLVIGLLAYFTPSIKNYFEPTKNRVEQARENLTSASNRLQKTSQMVESADSLLMKAGKTNWVKSKTSKFMDKLHIEKIIATIELDVAEKKHAADYTLKEYTHSNDAFYAQAILHLAGLHEAIAGPISESAPTGAYALKIPSSMAKQAQQALQETSVASLGLYDSGVNTVQQVSILNKAGIKATIAAKNQINSTAKQELLVLAEDKEKAMTLIGLEKDSH